MTKVLLCMVVIAVAATSITKADIMDDVKELAKELSAECMKTNPLTEPQFAFIKKYQYQDNVEVHCFMACMLKSAGFMNEGNLLDKEAMISMSNQVFADNPKTREVAETFIEHCVKETNTATISASDVACGRAAIGFACLADNKEKYGISMIEFDK